MTGCGQAVVHLWLSHHSYAACTQGSSSRASFGRGSSSSSQHAPAPDMADADLATPIVRRGAGSTATFFTKVCCASPGRSAPPALPWRSFHAFRAPGTSAKYACLPSHTGCMLCINSVTVGPLTTAHYMPICRAVAAAARPIGCPECVVRMREMAA